VDATPATSSWSVVAPPPPPPAEEPVSEESPAPPAEETPPPAEEIPPPPAEETPPPPPADTTAPETTILSGPSGTTLATIAELTFSASESGSTFQCKLDSGSWASCASPRSLSGLAVGAHTFSVRATDPGGATIAGASLQGKNLTLARFVSTSSVTVKPGAQGMTVEHNRVTGGGQGIDGCPSSTTTCDDTAIIGNQLIGPFEEDAIH